MYHPTISLISGHASGDKTLLIPEISKLEYTSVSDINLTLHEDKPFLLVKWVNPGGDNKDTWTLVTANTNKVIRKVLSLLSDPMMVREYNDNTSALPAIDKHALEFVNKEIEIYGDAIHVVLETHTVL
jgi:hypothetical protein